MTKSRAFRTGTHTQPTACKQRFVQRAKQWMNRADNTSFWIWDATPVKCPLILAALSEAWLRQHESESNQGVLYRMRKCTRISLWDMNSTGSSCISMSLSTHLMHRVNCSFWLRSVASSAITENHSALISTKKLLKTLKPVVRSVHSKYLEKSTVFPESRFSIQGSHYF